MDVREDLARRPAQAIAGHSFGRRLVTAAAHALPDNTDLVTMSLLQAEVSHNDLSEGFGVDHKEQGSADGVTE
jgi:hypothetical protein